MYLITHGMYLIFHRFHVNFLPQSDYRISALSYLVCRTSSAVRNILNLISSKNPSLKLVTVTVWLVKANRAGVCLALCGRLKYGESIHWPWERVRDEYEGDGCLKGREAVV